jgi:hypothetical protein
LDQLVDPGYFLPQYPDRQGGYAGYFSAFEIAETFPSKEIGDFAAIQPPAAMLSPSVRSVQISLLTHRRHNKTWKFGSQCRPLNQHTN